MTRSTVIARHLVNRLSPILGLLLCVALFTGGVHHHDDGRQHACAVCTIGHSPAMAGQITAPPAAPAGPVSRLHAPITPAPCRAHRGIASSRAPPLA
jgi:hypothetical protein